MTETHPMTPDNVKPGAMTMIEVQTAPIETVTPIRPSEAIRLGCLLAPVQVFIAESDGSGGACAMGAMRLGFGGHDNGISVSDTPAFVAAKCAAKARFGPDKFGPCPDCGRAATDVPHLNDDHRWSRERIADWLEGLGL